MSVVLDASAVIELLLQTPAGRRVADRIEDHAAALHAPCLVDLEVAQVLRRLVRAHLLDGDEATDAFSDLRGLAIRRHAHEPLIDRIWELRHDLTAYDACYAALAEALGAVLVTCDEAISGVRSLTARVEFVDPRPH